MLIEILLLIVFLCMTLYLNLLYVFILLLSLLLELRILQGGHVGRAGYLANNWPVREMINSCMYEIGSWLLQIL